MDKQLTKKFREEWLEREAAEIMFHDTLEKQKRKTIGNLSKKKSILKPVERK